MAYGCYMALADYSYSQAIDINPNNYDSHYTRSQIASSIGDDKKTVEIFDKYLKQNPSSYEAAYWKAIFMRNHMGLFDKQAIYQAFIDCMNIQPYNKKAVMAAVDFLLAIKEYTKAQIVIDRYIELNQSDIEPFSQKIEILEKQPDLNPQEKFAAILKVVDNYISHNPNDISGYIKKIGVLESHRDLMAAIKLSDECLIKFNGYYSFCRWLSELLSKIPKNDPNSFWESSQKQIIKTCQDIIIKSPDSYYLHELLAEIYLSEKQYDQIILLWNNFIKNNPYNYDGYHALAEVEHARGPAHFDAAIKYYDKYLEINPESRKVYLDKVNMLKSQEKHQEVESLLYKSIKLFPNNYEFYKILGQLLMKHNEVEKANNLVETIIQQNPDNYEQYKHAASYYLYVCSYADSDRETTAIKILERYIQLKPGEFQAYEKIANIIIEPHNDDIKEVRQAMKYFNKYLDASPNNDEKYLNVVGFLRNVSSWKRKMMGEDLSKNDTECYLMMNKLLDKHIKLYPKDWRAYEKKIDCLRELKKYPDMHKAFDDYFIQNREDYFVFYIKMKLVDYKTPSEAINACMIFIQHRAEYLMQTHQLVDVAEFVVLCKNIAGWMVDKLCPTWYEYTRKSYKESYKEFLEKRNDYLADLYYQLVNILKSASLMDASLIDAYVDIYKEVLVLKPDHKEAKQALENILKFKDTLKAIEIKEINDFVIVACIDHNDNYLNSQQAKDDLAIIGRLDDVLKRRCLTKCVNFWPCLFKCVNSKIGT